MTDIETMFARILADPYDNQLRLDYAKSVKPTDPDHALLIEKQIQYHLLRSIPGAYALTGAINMILKDHRVRLAGSIPALCKNFDFERGFIELILITAADWIKNGQQVKALAPVLDLVLFDLHPAAKEFFAQPTLKGIRSLELRHSDLTDDDVIELANSPYLDQLMWLNLSDNKLGQKSLDAIAGSEYLKNLRWLGFADNEVEDPTPEVYEDMGTITYVKYPESGKELELKFGQKIWLSQYYGFGHPAPYEMVS